MDYILDGITKTMLNVLAIGLPILLILIVIKRIFPKPEPDEEIVVEEATIISTGVERVMQLEYNNPKFYDAYEITFAFEGKTKTFEVSKFEYAVLSKGDKGKLVYTRYEIVSFSDKIKKIDQED